MDFFEQQVFTFTKFMLETQISEGTAITVTFGLAIVTAAVGFVASHSRELSFQRNQNSVSFYHHENKALDFVGKPIRNKAMVAFHKNIRISNEQLKEYLDDTIEMLNYYEKAAVGVRNGFFSENYILQTEYSTMLRFFAFMSATIAHSQEKSKNKYAGRNFEIFAIRGLFPEIRIATKLPALILGRPQFYLSFYLFLSIYHFHRVIYLPIDYFRPKDRIILPTQHLQCHWYLLRKRVSKTWIAIAIALGASFIVTMFDPLRALQSEIETVFSNAGYSIYESVLRRHF